MESKEEAKAIASIADAAGKGIDATRDFGKFISKYLGGTMEQGVGIVNDKLAYMRWENQQKLILKAKRYLSENGMSSPTRPIPMKTIIPLLQGASLEDEEELQDRWAKLLVNAADIDSGVVVTRNFIDILERLTPFDVNILDKIYSVEAGDSILGIRTSGLPDEITDQFEVNFVSSRERDLSLATLHQLYLISDDLEHSGDNFLYVKQTTLGRAFIDVCTIRSEKEGYGLTP